MANLLKYVKNQETTLAIKSKWWMIALLCLCLILVFQGKRNNWKLLRNGKKSAKGKLNTMWRGILYEKNMLIIYYEFTRNNKIKREIAR